MNLDYVTVSGAIFGIGIITTLAMLLVNERVSTPDRITFGVTLAINTPMLLWAFAL